MNKKIKLKDLKGCLKMPIIPIKLKQHSISQLRDQQRKIDVIKTMIWPEFNEHTIDTDKIDFYYFAATAGLTEKETNEILNSTRFNYDVFTYIVRQKSYYKYSEIVKSETLKMFNLSKTKQYENLTINKNLDLPKWKRIFEESIKTKKNRYQQEWLNQPIAKDKASRGWLNDKL